MREEKAETDQKEAGRRRFLRQLGGLGIVAAGIGSLDLTRAEAAVPRRRFGRTNEMVGMLGLGCIYFRGVEKSETDAIIGTGLDLGVNLIEVGPAYGDAVEKVGYGIKERREEVFLASKSYNRKKEAALADVDDILTKCNTDHIDLCSLHDISSPGEYDLAFGPGGTLEGLLEAKKAGKFRFLGITGHYIPAHIAAIESGQFDALLCVYNLANRETEGLLKLAKEKDIGVQIMKPLGAVGLLKEADLGAAGKEQFTDAEALRFILSNDAVTCAVVGCTTAEQMRHNVALVNDFEPLTEEERRSFIERGNRMARGLCGNCSHACEEVCPVGVPVAYILERLEFLDRFYYDIRRLGDEYDALGKTVKDCPAGCDRCEKACLYGLPVRERLKGADDRLKNARKRVMNTQ